MDTIAARPSSPSASTGADGGTTAAGSDAGLDNGPRRKDWTERLVNDRRKSVRHAAIAALLVLVVLNIADILTTNAFLAKGVKEGNPLMRHLVGNWKAVFVKAVLLLALWRSFAARRPTMARLCAVWGAVGFYASSIMVNLMILASVH